MKTADSLDTETVQLVVFHGVPCQREIGFELQISDLALAVLIERVGRK